MAVPKPKEAGYPISATLTEEEHDLLAEFAEEQGIKDVNQAIPALLHELVRLHDLLWDKQFEQIPPGLEAMAKKALDDHRAGLTEDLDI